MKLGIKNRKGFLLTEETLKIIIAVIGLGVLIYFLSALYFSNVQDKKEVEAAGTIERISQIVSGLNSSEEKILSGVQPQGWSLFGFVGSERKPNSCLGKNCICICDEVFVDNLPSFGLIEDRQIKECSESGKCLPLEDMSDFENFEISLYSEGLTGLGIKENENGEIIFREIK